jgi:hypothetical protein
MFVQAGSHQDKEGNFPRLEGQLKFLVAHFNRRMANWERVESMACLFQAKRCSLLFLLKTYFTRVQICAGQGWKRDWKNLCHLNSFQSWKELEIRLVSKQTDELIPGPWRKQSLTAMQHHSRGKRPLGGAEINKC